MSSRKQTVVTMRATAKQAPAKGRASPTPMTASTPRLRAICSMTRAGSTANRTARGAAKRPDPTPISTVSPTEGISSFRALTSA